MKNVNRDYLVKVDPKTAKITPPANGMKFFMTDIWTSNIFFQLVSEESTNSLINSFNEDASKYTLTLRIVKPNNKTETVNVTMLNQSKNFFVADLPTECIDIPGICKCELFIDTTVNGRAERATTDKFEYEVKYSIFYDLEELLGRNEYVSIENVVTKDYVDSILNGDVDLKGYVSDNELIEALLLYATNESVDNKIANIGSGDTISIRVNGVTYTHINGVITLPDYSSGSNGGSSYDDTELRNLINTKANKTDIPVTLPANGGNSDTVDNIHIWTGTQEEYDAIPNKSSITMYVIKG